MMDYRRRSEKLLRLEIRDTEFTIFVRQGVDVNPVYEDLMGLQLKPSARFQKHTSLRRIWLLCKMKFCTTLGRSLSFKRHWKYTIYLSPIKIYRSNIEPAVFDAIVSRLAAEPALEISMNDLARICHAAFWVALPHATAEPLVRSWYN